MSVFSDLFGFGDHATMLANALDGWPGSAAQNVAGDQEYQALVARQAAHCPPPKIDPWMMLNALAPKLTEAQKTARAGSPWMDLA